MLLNAALVFTSKDDAKLHVKEFRVFMQRVLSRLDGLGVELVLFGSMARDL